MTICEYNGIRIHNVQVESVQQNVEYDATGTDQLFVRTRLTLRGVVFHGQMRDPTRPHIETADLPVPLGEHSPREIAAYLSQPRKTFRLYIKDDKGERTLFMVDPATEQPQQHTTRTDVDRGPRPLAVNVVHVAKWGYELVFEIEFALQHRMNPSEIYQQNGRADWALNNRWSVSEALDENFFMTRTYQGTIRLSQAVPDYQFAARWLAFPQLEPGFKRESCDYTVTGDGLTVQYRIVDKQQAHAPPWPCTRMEVTHSETLTKYGYYVQSACHVRLWGPPGVPKSMLLARLAQILRARLLWDGAFGKSAFLESLRIVDEIGPDNLVHGEMVINRFPSAAEADKNDPKGDQAVADAALAAQFIAAIPGGPAALLGAALGAVVGRIIAGGKAKPNQGNAPAPPPPGNDWFQKLTRNVLGTDLSLPSLVGAQGWNPLGPQLLDTFGEEHCNYWQHMVPEPSGYTPWGTTRHPALAVFFACYYQMPDHPPHHFHPGEQPPVAPPNDRNADQQAVAPPAQPREVVAIEDNRADVTARAHAVALYTHATLQNDYDIDRGRVVFAKSITGHYGDPMENDDGEEDLEVVTVARPVQIRRIAYEAERIGTWPEIPWPADYDLANNAKAKLLRFRIQPQPPSLAPDGVHLVYRVQAQYEWAITRALAGATLDVATLPTVRSDAVQPFALSAVASSALLLDQARGTS
jgi:hypothetical protein